MSSASNYIATTLNFLTDPAPPVAAQDGVARPKVDWNTGWDVDKAVRVLGFKSWGLLEPGNKSYRPTFYLQRCIMLYLS